MKSPLSKSGNLGQPLHQKQHIIHIKMGWIGETSSTGSEKQQMCFKRQHRYAGRHFREAYIIHAFELASIGALWNGFKFKTMLESAPSTEKPHLASSLSCLGLFYTDGNSPKRAANILWNSHKHTGRFAFLEAWAIIYPQEWPEPHNGLRGAQNIFETNFDSW